MLRLLALFALFCALFTSGCGYFRLPVLQGNIVDYEKAEKLELGMTPAQVEFLLGTPLIRDSFGTPRWDYVVYYRSPDADVLQRSLSVYFEGEQVSRIEGRDEMLATWRKQRAAIEKAKREKKLLEKPHPGQLPADVDNAPADAAGNEHEHAVLPPRDPETREEVLGKEPQPKLQQPGEPDEDNSESVPTPPEPAVSNTSDESSAAQSGQDAAAANSEQSENTTSNQADYPPDMSTIYQ